MTPPRRSDDDLEKALANLRKALRESPIGKLAFRLNSWLEVRQDRWWWRALAPLDTLGRWMWNAWIVFMVIVGAAVAGWALASGPWGVVLAIPVGLGAYLFLKNAPWSER